MNSTLSPGAVKVVAVSTVFTFFAIIFVCLRLLARFGFTKVGRRDEIAIVASLICSLGVLAATIREAKYGLGKPSPTLSLEDKEEFLKSLFVAIIFYNISLTLTKFAIVLQYMRVFTTGKIRYYCWISMALVVGFGIESLGISLFACSPVSAFWDLTNTNGHCVDKRFLWFFNASFSIFTDIVLLALPIPVLLKLVIPKNQKILLMGIFALGGFACLVSILRLQSLYAASTADDLILKNINSGMWSTIEINTGIICASLQTIRPVVAKVFPNLFTSTSRRGYERTIDTGSRAYVQDGSNATNVEMFSSTRSTAPRPPSQAITSPSSSTASQGFAPWREDIEKADGGIVVTTSVGVSVHQAGVERDGKTFFRP